MNDKSVLRITTILLILYYIFTILNPRDRYADVQSEGRIYPQICMTLVVVICAFYVFVEPIFCRKLKCFYFFIGLFWLYSFTSSASFFETLSYVVKSTSGYLFTLFFYKQFVKNKELAEKASILISFVIVVYGLFQFQITKEETIAEAHESTVGFIYSQLFPIALLFYNKRWSPYMFLVCLVMTILSGQRMPSLLALLYCIPAFIVYRKQFNLSRLLIISVVFFIVALPYIISGIDNITLRNEYELNKGGTIGSGRDLFYSLVFNDYLDCTLFNQILGNGIYSSLDLIRSVLGKSIFAHNGWLDTVYQFGILGLSIFSYCIFVLFSYARAMRFTHPVFGLIVLFMGLSWILKSSFSHGYLDLNSLPFCISLAYIIQKWELDMLSFENPSQEQI